MKRYSLWVKCLVFFLAVVTLLGVAVSGLGILMAESMNMYTSEKYEDWMYDRCRDMAGNIADQVLRDYANSFSDCPEWVLEQSGRLYAIQNLEGWYELDENDWCYTIYNKDYQPLRSTYREEFRDNSLHFIIGTYTDYLVLSSAETGGEWYWNDVTQTEVFVQRKYTEEFQVDVWISKDYTSYYKFNGMSQGAMQWLFAAKHPLIVAAAVCLLIFAVSFIFLMTLAGKDSKTGAPVPRALNRLPLDLYLGIAVLVSVVGCWLAYEMLDMLFGNDGYNVLMIVLLCGCGVIVATVDVGFFMALAAQFKVPGRFWWNRSICGSILKWLWKGARFCVRCCSKVFALLPVIWEWMVIGFVLAFGLLITLLITFETDFPLFLLWWCGIGAVTIGYGGWCYGTIRKGVHRMKEGDLYQKINTEWMFGSFKAIAEDLNALADVAAIAAEKQVKSERMKTELITNVSHDIKTPLTSVINYVDLLQQPHTEEEGVQYLEVLSRQSLRLKKLVEDLMDMSKASTGNVVVNPVPMDAVEAVNQALGEFADKLDSANLIPVFRPQMPQMHMLADGKLTWRVLSNLLGNVVKYAMPGTRVYLDLLRVDKQVIFAVKNISREELNISAEELAERFVRGDASRNTEGSGLGLNIAQNLMALQRGTMDITVDGDLFKVTLTFPTE